MKALRVLKLLYVQVLIATAAGIVVGLLFPHTGEALRPLGDAFIKVIRMIIAPVVFCTVAIGIAHMSDLKKFGRVGGKTLLYFELVSTLALIIGLVVGNVIKPGAGFNIDAASLDPNIAAQYTKGAASMSFVDQMMKIIPDTMVSAFVTGDLLQVLFVAILTGFACSRLGNSPRSTSSWSRRDATGFARSAGLWRAWTLAGPIDVRLFTDGGGGESLLDEHDRNVRDDRVDQPRGGAEQSLLDHRRLVAEMLPVLLRQHPADFRRQLDQLQLALRLGADEYLQQLRIDRHRAPLSRAQHSTAGSGVRAG